MANPYDILEVDFGDSDQVIRERYLEAVRRFPPERSPQEFKRVREAYELIRDEENRLKFMLFDPQQGESIEELLVEERCRSTPKRVSLPSLLSLLGETA